MLPLPASPARCRSANHQAGPSPGTHRYQRHRPEQTLLYPQAGRKVFTLQTLPPRDVNESSASVGTVSGFSRHAGVAAKAHQRDKLERLCRYIARPALSEKRLSLTSQGNIRYTLKTPYRDGTTHVLFEPLDFIARLAALIPKPRVNLTRYHGVFCTEQPPARAGGTGPARPPAHACPARGRRGRGNRPDRRHGTRGHDVGAALEAGVQDRHRNLQPVRRNGEDHRLHRRPGGDRKDTHAPEQKRRLRETRPAAREPGTPSSRPV